MRHIVAALLILAVAACDDSSTPAAATPPKDAAAAPIAPAAAKPSPFVARALASRGGGYCFDLLSAPVAPGERTTQRATLQPGQAVAGDPVLVPDPETGELGTFAIESAKTEGGVYTVTARNTGKKAARLVADVKCVAAK